MSLSPQNPSHRTAVISTKHSSNFPTPSLLPSALPTANSTQSKTPSKQGPNDSAASNPTFAPFFTLVEDIHTTEHHHPTVHYIFADDSTDLITEAALRTLEPPSPSPSITHSQQHSHNNRETKGNNTTSTTDDDHPTDLSPLPLLPPPRPGITDRYILLDLSLPPSSSVNAVPAAHAHSLTPDWQVLNVEVSRAPTWDADPDLPGAGGAERNRGLMLKIEGTEGVRDGLELGNADENGEPGGGKREMDMEGLVGVFEKRMAELRRLIDVEAGGWGLSSVMARGGGS